MRKVIAALAMLALAMPALAVDIAKDPNVVIEGTNFGHDDVIVRGDAAQVNLLDGIFTDLSGYWAGGLSAAGYTPDIYYDPAGGIDYSTYLIVIADCSDNWWFSMNYPMEPNAWRSYLDGGGKMVLVGQDFLYGSGDLALLTGYFGVGSVVEDVNYNDSGNMTWNGTAGGPLDGLSGSMLPCFASNPWFTDDVNPAGGNDGVAIWTTPMYPNGEAGAATMSSIFSVVEFGCGSVDVVGAMDAYMGGIATENTSMSTVKALY